MLAWKRRGQEMRLLQRNQSDEQCSYDLLINSTAHSAQPIPGIYVGQAFEIP